jgi:4-hydroxybenzoate polyprenyltransferase
MSASSRAEPLPTPRAGVLAWARERTRPSRFAVLALAVAAAGATGAPWPGAPAFLGRAALALVLVLALRLLDDLVDLHRDRAQHPARVLPRAPSPRPFVVALASTLALGGAALALLGPMRLAGLALLVLLLGGWYALGTRRPWPHALVLLAKYPALALLVGAPDAAPGPRALALGLLYAALVAHERATDPALR